MSALTEHPEQPGDGSRPVRRRSRLTAKRAGALGVGVLLVVIYLLVLLMYWRSTQQDEPLDLTESDDPRVVLVNMEVTGITPQDRTMSVNVKVFPGTALTDDTGALRNKLQILLFRVDNLEFNATSPRVIPLESTKLTFDTGSILPSSVVKLRPAGQYQNYPFDTYSGYVGVAALWTEGTKTVEVPAVLILGGDAPGWTVESQHFSPEPDQHVDLGDTALYFSVSRAGSTVAIVVLLLAALAVMVLCSLFVARSVLVKRRRIEATMASWFAALLFAVIPLRLNMPGSPPMGVWIDFLVVLWVEMGLMTALAIFIYSWLAYTPKPDYAPPEPEPEPEPDRDPQQESGSAAADGARVGGMRSTRQP